MRLICPNCATQYEVDDSAVPAAGREVQCGNCASTWFQAPARSNVAGGTEKQSDLPEWVEEIVEDDALEEAAELPGSAPEIVSAPNEDIVSEPELEGLIDTGDLATTQNDLPEAVTKETKDTQTPATDTPAEPEPVLETEPDTTEQVSTELAQKDADERAADTFSEPEGEPSTEDVDDKTEDIKAATLAKTASQAAVAATIANMTGAPARSETPAEPSGSDGSDPDVEDVETPIVETETVEPEEVKPETIEPQTTSSQDVEASTVQPETDETPDASDDISTKLEAAIREQATAPAAEDLSQIGAAEIEAAKSAEDAAKASADAAIKAAEQAAAVEFAEKAAVQTIEVPEADVSDKTTHEISDQVSQAVEETVEETVAKAVSDADPAPSSDAPTPEGQADKETTDAIAAEIQNALNDLDAGKPVPENQSEEKLSDYDLTEAHDIPEEFAAVLPDEASGPIQGPTERFDPAEITVDKPDMSMPSMVASQQENADDAATPPQTKAEQTETLAAKLKARVAEAAQAQASTAAVGTAGVVLGASAAGIAAAGGREKTAFPKRDTETLSSSLRPKSTDGGSIKPRLRPSATPEPKKSRFGQGFLLAVACFAVALLVYLFRAQIATAIPALDPPLTSYASVIDNVRLIFQDAIGKLTGSVSGEGQS